MTVWVGLSVYAINQMLVLPILETRSYPVRYVMKGDVDSGGISRYNSWINGNGSGFLGEIAFVMVRKAP